MILKTPSGYEVELKDKLSFGELRQLQKGLFEGIKSEMGKVPEIEFNRLIEYSEKAFPYLVVKITKGGKVVTGDLLEEVNSWDVEDAELVFDHLNLVAQPVVEAKKK
jgi:hypothetical protein